MFTNDPTHAAHSKPLADLLDLIKFELVSEYEDTGRIDIADWVRRHPEFRGELIDFWVALKGTRESERGNGSDGQPWRRDAEIYEQALRDACLAVTLGPEWLAPAVDPELQSLASDLEGFRKTRPARNPKQLAFPKAVVCTWVVTRLQRNRPRVTRLATQKVSYLLEQAMGLSIFVEHNQKPLGPYDSNARYKDAEPIAMRKGWLTVKGTELKARTPAPEMAKYIEGYLRSESVAARLTERLSNFSDDQLETVATVHWIARDLCEAGTAINEDAVLEQLSQIPVWKRKLTRSNFRPANVREALIFLRSLRLVA